MFLGEFVLFLTSNARFFFATAQNLTNTYAMPRQDKIEKIKAIFCTKEGWRFFLSTIANAGNRSWEFWGACSYIMLYVFLTTNKYKTIPIAAIVIISSFYQTLFCQSASDYETVFDKKQNNEKKEFNMLGKAVILIPLFILQLFTLILKTLQTPSLYTGVIDDPEKDYTIIITFIAFLGLIGGGFGGYQSAFGYNGPLAKQAMRDLLPNCFFKKLMGEPLLNKSHKYTRVAPLEITQDSTLH